MLDVNTNSLDSRLRGNDGMSYFGENLSPLHNNTDDSEEKRKNVPALLLTRYERPIRRQIEYRNWERLQNMLPCRNGQSDTKSAAAEYKRTGRRTRKRKVPSKELGNALGFRPTGKGDL